MPQRDRAPSRRRAVRRNRFLSCRDTIPAENPSSSSEIKTMQHTVTVIVGIAALIGTGDSSDAGCLNCRKSGNCEPVCHIETGTHTQLDGSCFRLCLSPACHHSANAMLRNYGRNRSGHTTWSRVWFPSGQIRRVHRIQRSPKYGRRRCTSPLSVSQLSSAVGPSWS